MASPRAAALSGALALGLLGPLGSLEGCTQVDPRPDSGVVHPARLPFEREPGRRYFCDLRPEQDVTRAGLPYGFCVRRYANDVGAPRVIAFAPNGDLFVASPSEATPGGAPAGDGAILVLPDDDGDGVADRAVRFLAGVRSVHGLLFADDYLYFTQADGVYRVPYARATPPREGRTTAAAPEKVADLTGLSRYARWTHTLAQARDGTIYVSQGQYASYTCPSGPSEGAVLRLVPGSMRPEVVSSGHRNPLYLRCDPEGTTCYAAELSDDTWDPSTGTEGREKLVILRSGEDYGYPCCAGPNASAPPGRARGQSCARVAAELRQWPLHDTPFGMDFDRGNLPEPWRNGFFVGLHGEFGTWAHTKIEWSPVDPATHQPTGQWQDFVTGWGRSTSGVVGRITDVLFAPDGRLFFTDDQGRGVYWVAPEVLAVPR